MLLIKMFQRKKMLNIDLKIRLLVCCSGSFSSSRWNWAKSLTLGDCYSISYRIQDFRTNFSGYASKG